MTEEERRARDQLAQYEADRRAGRKGTYPLGALMAAHPAKLRDDFRRGLPPLLRKQQDRC